MEDDDVIVGEQVSGTTKQLYMFDDEGLPTKDKSKAFTAIIREVDGEGNIVCEDHLIKA